MIKVINNFLNNDHLEEIFVILKSNQFPWFYNTAQKNFEHTLIRGEQELSGFLRIIEYFQKQITYKKIIDFNIEYFPMMDKVIFFNRHNNHIKNCTTVILHMNKNDGFTEIIGGPKVPSEENRALIFPSILAHKHSSTTNSNGRYVINMSYI